jgi:cyclic pyranopterin phosphate synthase
MRLKNNKVLRISVTDRCDLRCIYCMPESGVTLVSPEDLLTYEEIERVAAAAMKAGVRRFRITGGEPLVRRGIEKLVEKLARLGPDDLALTTNGLHLGETAATLKEAGLKRVTISLDTLRSGRFETITRRTGFSRILEGLEAARRAGLHPIKVNTVVIRGINDDEIEDFVRFAEREKVEVRFIELMPTSGLSPECKELGKWRPALFVKGDEVRERVAAAFGPLEYRPREDGVAKVYRTKSGTKIGIIMPISDPFCRGCERLRLSADGRLKLCLFDGDGIHMKKALRESGASDDALAGLLRAALGEKEKWERGSLELLSSEMFKVGG